MTNNTRKWLYIALGVFVVLVFLGIGAIFVTVTYVQNHLDVSKPSESEAIQAFDEIHRKFPGRAPLLEWKNDHPVASTAQVSSSQTKLTTLHLLAWDEDDGELAKIDLPFWLLRMKSGPIKFGTSAYRWDDEQIRLTVEDIERYGPGIVLDFSQRNRGRALVWAE